MDPYASVGKALTMPELLTSILRYLGPLDWLPCSAVCSWWSTALHDNGTPSPEARATNLWRDFAEIWMTFSYWRRPSCRKNTYKTVCLEGNPAVLGPPLRVTGGDNDAIVMLSSVAEASLARSRRPRALAKFLLQWGSYGPVVPSAAGDARRARVLVCEDSIRFVYPRNFGRSGSTSSREAVIPGAGSSANRAAKKADRRRSKTLPSVLATTAMVNDGLRVFTRNFVLCRRCRSTRTTLCASEHQSAFGVSRSKVFSGSGELMISVECQEDRCGLAFGVHVDRKRSPLWLTKFTEYVLHRTWEDINTFEADHGTEWFSDTSPEAVQRRQEEARAESLGLDALVNRTGDSNPRKENR